MKYIGHNLRYLDTPIKRLMYLVKIEIKIFSTTVKGATYSRVRLIIIPANTVYNLVESQRLYCPNISK